MKMQNGKSKQLSSSSPKFVKGGSGKMLHEAHTGPQKPGVSGVSKGPSGGFGAKGGNGHMTGRNSVKPAKPGGSVGSGGGRRYGGQANGDAY